MNNKTDKKHAKYGFWGIVAALMFMVWMVVRLTAPHRIPTANGM